MKTIIFKSLLVTITIIGISNYLLYLKTGKFLITSFPSIDIASKLPGIDVLKNKVSNGSSATEKLYKWTDEKGKVHYSTQAPLEETWAKEILVDPNANVVKAIELPKLEVTRDSGLLTPEIAPTNAYDLGMVGSLIDDAKEVQALMDARTQRLEKAVDTQ